MLWRTARSANIQRSVALPAELASGEGFLFLLSDVRALSALLVWQKLLTTELPQAGWKIAVSDSSLAFAFPDSLAKRVIQTDLDSTLGSARVGVALVRDGSAEVLVLGEVTEAGLEALLV